MKVLVELDQSEVRPVMNGLEVTKGSGPMVVIFKDSERRITVRKARRIYTTKETCNEKACSS